MEDTFADLDLDKLELLITMLKDAEVPYFRVGALEIGMSQQEPEKPVGFIPGDQRAAAQAKKAKDNGKEDDAPEHMPEHYRKAFQGRKVPTLKPKANGPTE